MLFGEMVVCEKELENASDQSAVVKIEQWLAMVHTMILHHNVSNYWLWNKFAGENISEDY